MDSEFFSNYKKTVAKQKGIPHFTMNQPVVHNNLPGTIGLELEIEATRALPRDGSLDAIYAPTTHAMWRSVQDGSLRGEAREYIFSQPCAREEVKDMVEKLFKVFDAMKVGINNSNRCSTHVHINMKGKRINQLTSIVALWGTFEEALIAWCGEERKVNHFCLSMQDASTVVDEWTNYLRMGRFNGMGEDRHGLKYHALNILTLFTKGSLEFRCGGAANEPQRVITWATFLDKFVEFAADKYTNPMQIAFDLSERGATAMFEELCGTELKEFAGQVIDNPGDFDDKCMKGFRNVQPIILGFPWNDWLPLISKEYIPDPFAKPMKKVLNRARGGRIEPAMEEVVPRFQEWREVREVPLQAPPPQALDPVQVARQADELAEFIRIQNRIRNTGRIGL